MSGKEIRRWAWGKTNKQRGIVTATVLIGTLPAIFVSFLNVRLSWPWKAVIGWPLFFLTSLLGMGTEIIILNVAQEKKAKIQQVTTAFQKEWFKKILIVALFQVLLSTIISAGPLFLEWKGQQMIRTSGYQEMLLNGRYLEISTEIRTMYEQGGTMMSLGSLLQNIFLLIYTTITFPLYYLLLLFPEKTAFQVIREGVSLGFRSFWRILCFHFWVYLPLAGCFVALVLVFVVLELMELFSAVLFVLAAIGISLWYLPYAILADAGLGLDLLGKMKTSVSKGKKKKR